MKNKTESGTKRFGRFLKYNWFFIIAGLVIAMLLWLALGYSL